MSRLRMLFSRLSGRGTSAIDREVEEEIQFHLAMREQANRRAGMSPEAAARSARRSFGDPERVRRAGRQILAGAPPARDGASLLDTILQDVRYGIRVLAKNRTMTLAAGLSLALGIGINTANFSLVYGILHRQLPFADPDRLLYVDGWNPTRGDGDGPITWADLDAARRVDALEGVAAMTGRNFTVTGGDLPERVAGAAITPGMFELLGVEPQRGRLFRAGEGAEAGFETVALISDGLWRRMFGGDEEILGQTLRLNGRELTIIGVMPVGFRFPEREDLWLPLASDDPTSTSRSIRAIARMRPGAEVAAVQHPLDEWSALAERESPETHRDWTLRAMPFRDAFIDAGAQQMLYLMLAAVGLVLLLACANVANLLLAQAAHRRRELVVRSALGASRWRLARQMLTEAVILALGGGLAGLAVAHVWVRLLGAGAPPDMAFWIRVVVDRAALLYALGISVLTGLLFGVLPALQAARDSMSEELRQSGRGATHLRGTMRSSLVVAEVALSVVLLISAALMVKSFLQLQIADPGFDDRQMLSMRVNLAGDRYDDLAVRAQYFDAAAEQIAALPGVVAATATGAIPADDGGGAARVFPTGTGNVDESFFANVIPSTPDFFATLDVELLDGRRFTRAESDERMGDVAIVGQTLARRLWPDGDAVGRSLTLGSTREYRVVGIAPDLQYEEFGEDMEGARLQLHLPYAVGSWRAMAFLIRGSGDPGALVNPVRDVLQRIDATQAPYDILTMPERRAATTSEHQLLGASFAAFGLMAVVLAVCGVYGVIAHSVAQRTQEIGVRIALGARPRDVLRQVVLGAMRLATVGVLFGLAGAVLFTRGMGGILYGINPTEPLIFGSVGVGLLAAATAAALLPARRAAGVDPTEALRAD